MSDDPQKLLEEANSAFGSGDFAKANELWEKIIGMVEADHHYALYTNCGAALERLGRVEEAIAAYDNALSSKPDHVEALHNRGVALKACKRSEDALASFEDALKHNGDFYPSVRGKTDILMTLERFDEAAETATKAISLKSQDPGPYSDRAFAFLRLKKLEASIADYETAHKLGDRSAETQRLYAIALSQRAVELDKSGDFAVAEDYYTRAIDVEATESRVFNRAFLFMRAGKTDDAIAGFKQVADMAPANFQARAALGTLLLQKESFEDAAASLSAAADMKPDQSDVVFNLGFAYLKLQKPDDAEAQFRKALELDPSMEQAQSGLQAAVVMKGQLSGERPKVKLAVDSSVSISLDGPSDASSPRAPSMAASSGSAAPKVLPFTAARMPSGIGKTMSPAASPAASFGRKNPNAVFLGNGVPMPMQVVRDPIAEEAFAQRAAQERSSSPSQKYAAEAEGVEGTIYPYANLKAPGPYPDGIDLAHREAYLSTEEFIKVFGMSRTEFYNTPKWKRVQMRKSVGMF